jgi:hypothetical protein
VTVSLPRGSTELERIADISGVPVIDGSRVCAAAFQGKVACFEIQTRNMVWSRDIWSSRGLAVDAKNIYIADDNGNVHALDKAAGASVWKQDKLAYRRLTAPLIVGARIVVGDGQGYLHVLSPDDGASSAVSRRRHGHHDARPGTGRARRPDRRRLRRRGAILKPTVVLVGPPQRREVDALQPAHALARRAGRGPSRGLTRDRHYGQGRLGDKAFIVVDTGGFEPSRRKASSRRWRCRRARRSPKPTW